MSAFKAQAMARDLSARLSAANPSLTITETDDSDFMPELKITNGSDTLFVKIEVQPQADGAVDGLGLDQRLYSPHQITILRDANATVSQLRESVTTECGRSGTKVRIFEVNPLPSDYDLSGATEVAELKSNQWHPLTLSE